MPIFWIIIKWDRWFFFSVTIGQLRRNKWNDISIFLDWRTRYCQNDYTTQGNLQSQWFYIKLPVAFFTELEQKSKIFMEIQNTTNSQSNLEGKMELEGSGFLTSDYTTKLQSSRQYGLAQKQKYRPMQQDRTPRDKSTHLRLPYF